MAVASGSALADGKGYLNNASLNVNIPSAIGAGNLRIDRIVLRASWAAFTVAITRIAGTDAASPTAPAITQTSGTTYDIMLHRALVDTAGTVTLTDERTLAGAFAAIRQGGGPTHFGAAGVTNYALPANWKIQFGVITGTIAGANVVYGTAFTGGIPMVFVSVMSAPGTSAISTNHTINGFVAYTFGGTASCAWLAIGPMA